MADSNVIAYLFPGNANGSDCCKVREIIEHSYNKSRYLPPQRLPSSAAFTGDSPNLYNPCLQLTFGPGPRFRQGLIFGWDPECDIVLPKNPRISFHHGAFNFDDKNRPIYRDLGSRSGNQVTYSCGGEGRRSDFRWVLGAHPILDKKAIILTFTEDLSFEVVICKHELTSQQYIDNVKSFRQGTEEVETLLDRFDITRPQTEPVSGAETPAVGLLQIPKIRGATAIPSYVLDVG